MARFLPDTSCIVAVLCDWHVRHADAMSEIARRLTGGDTMAVAAPALVETYSVLTRLPPPRRIPPVQAWTVLEAFVERAELAVLGATAYRQLLQGAPQRGIAGGSIYDAVIVACAVAAGADALLTLNERHFRPLATQGIQIVVPP